MVWAHGKQIDPQRNPVIRLFRKLVPVTAEYRGDKFFVRHEGKLMATPLMVVLIFVELSDLVFAVDSIPAILAITRDPFIVYTSNALAILGLRSMYFAVSGLMSMFQYLHYGLAAILVFVGGKMLLADVAKVPVMTSLGVIVGILVLSVIASMLVRPHTNVTETS
jgi:tellurite resistance protein TerC